MVTTVEQSTGKQVYTAGYGNRGFDGFVELMRRFGVTHLVDVRSVPQSSYWEDFRKERLERIVPPTGLKYVYMGDTLGGVRNSPVLCKDPEAVDIHPLFNDPDFRKGLTVLIKALDHPDRVICLMCGCKRPHGCHRSRLIGTALEDLGVGVVHIDADESLVPQSAVAESQREIQASLF